jgi:hypothetical protein
LYNAPAVSRKVTPGLAIEYTNSESTIGRLWRARNPCAQSRLTRQQNDARLSSMQACRINRHNCVCVMNSLFNT